MKPNVKYQCPVCERQYDTEEEAVNCFVPLEQRFKVGDILYSQNYRYALRIVYPISSNSLGISAEHVPEYDIAHGNTPKKGIDARGCYIGGYQCTAKKFEVKEAQKMVSDLKKRLKAAESFLDMVKACQ